MTSNERLNICSFVLTTNMLIRKFRKCSVAVKTNLFKSFCLCFYDIALWKTFNAGTMNKFRSCYNKCVKLFFGYRHVDSVTAMLSELALPTFDTVLINCKQRYIRCCNSVHNSLVACVYWRVFVSVLSVFFSFFILCLLYVACFCLSVCSLFYSFFIYGPCRLK